MGRAHGGAGESLLARLEHNRLVERSSCAAVVLTQKNAQQRRVGWHQQRRVSYRLHEDGQGVAQPDSSEAQTHRAQDVEAGAQPVAVVDEVSVCRLNEEKVVKPPKTPSIRNCRDALCSPAGGRPGR